jgi:hypothetical protein
VAKRSKSLVVKPTSRKRNFKKLKALKCFDLVLARIRDGWVLTQLARYIQDERNEYTEISHEGLTALLGEFRKSLPPGELIKDRMPGVFLAAKEHVEEGIDELEKMQELYYIQMQRIGIDFETERNINKLLPSMTSEIREARNILEAIGKMKTELGVHPRLPQEHNINVTAEVDGQLVEDLGLKFSSEAVRDVVKNPESRRRVLNTVERFLKSKNPTDSDTN